MNIYALAASLCGEHGVCMPPAGTDTVTEEGLRALAASDGSGRGSDADRVLPRLAKWLQRPVFVANRGNNDGGVLYVEDRATPARLVGPAEAVTDGADDTNVVAGVLRLERAARGRFRRVEDAPPTAAPPPLPRRQPQQPKRRRDPLNAQAVRRLARRGGVKRLTRGVADEVKTNLRAYLRGLLHDAAAILDLTGHHTVTVDLVKQVLGHRGTPLYT